MIGLIPAGGRALRLGPQPSSKEILPVVLPPTGTSGERPGAVSECLLESFATAGVETAFFVLAPGKWDIMEHFGPATEPGLSLGYLVRKQPFGVPHTIDSANRFVSGRRVAFGFPDVLFQPIDAISKLADHQSAGGADLVLGVFPIDSPSKWDAVSLDALGRVERVHPKPHAESSGLTWILAVWTPTFTTFLSEFVSRFNADPDSGDQADVSLGAVVQDALRRGLTTEAVRFDAGVCLDVGTPGDLARARRPGWWNRASGK